MRLQPGDRVRFVAPMTADEAAGCWVVVEVHGCIGTVVVVEAVGPSGPRIVVYPAADLAAE